ncbi:MAG: glycosyltransferase family 2 protein [Pyrinomonadaceae bacterium]
MVVMHVNAATPEPHAAEAHPPPGGCQPAVSIIMPAYNTAQYIGEALDSALAQTFTDYEIIVVNDGSPDTKELEQTLAPYRERIVYIEQENRGSSAARNTGLRASRGRFIALLDSDDVWEPEYLSTHVEALERDASIDVIYPNALLFGESSNAGKTYMEVCPSEGEITFARLVAQECYVWGGVTARRETVFRAGLFDEELGSAEDFDLWLRILHGGGRIAYHRRVLASYRQRRGSHTSDPVRLCRNFLKLLDKLTRTMKLSSTDQAAVDEQRARTQAMFHLYEGKQALFGGDVSRASECLTKANAFFSSRKIALTLLLLRLSPRLAMRAYDLRDRYVFKMSTRF